MATNSGNNITPSDIIAAAAPDGHRSHRYKEPMTRKCTTEHCSGSVYTVELIEGVHTFVNLYCDDCVEQIRAAELVKEKAVARAEWLRQTNAAWLDQWGGSASGYHKTTFEKLPHPHLSKKAMLWTPAEDMGLILTGPSGSGKTRTMYLLLNELRKQRQISVDVQPCIQLRQKIVQAARSQHLDTRDKLIKRLTTAPILYLDDLGQMNNTDAAAEALMEII
jgi:Cdc6-like AAA superfamily ATPase